MSSIYPRSMPEIARKRRDRALISSLPSRHSAERCFADGLLPQKVKQSVAVRCWHEATKAKAGPDTPRTVGELPILSRDRPIEKSDMDVE